MLSVFEVLYPNETIVRAALRGAAAYHLSWFDAHLWAYAEYYGLPELISEDFEHDRLYGTVRVVNPFRSSRPSHYSPNTMKDWVRRSEPKG